MLKLIGTLKTLSLSCFPYIGQYQRQLGPVLYRDKLVSPLKAH